MSHLAGNAFLYGVKPGGLTRDEEVRVLLCYVVRNAAPLTREDIEDALLSEQLVNYFELSGSLADLKEQQLVDVDENGFYSITPKGITVTDELELDLLPRSVRETAVRAAIRAQKRNRMADQHKAVIEKTASGYVVKCSIEDLDQAVFAVNLSLPDHATAELVKNAFVEKGDSIYAMVLNALTTPSGL